MQPEANPYDTISCLIAHLFEQLGGQFSQQLGLDLASEDDRALESWLLVSCLRSSRMDEEQAERIFHVLCASNCSNLQQIASVDAVQIAQALANADCKNPEREAAKFKRAAGALSLHYRGSLTRLAREAENAEDLAGRVAALAPGIGAATVLQFLRPLREVWRLADEIPLHTAAHTAAVHLQLLREGEDAEGAPSVLRAKLYAANEASSQTIAFADLEAALTRLGERACMRKKKTSCPMHEFCTVTFSCSTKSRCSDETS